MRNRPPSARARGPSSAAPAPVRPPTPTPLPEPAALPAGRRRAVALLLVALAAYGAAESLLWSRALWGFHFYAFYPGWALPAAAVAALAVALLLWRDPRPAPPAAEAPRSAPGWLPWLAGGLAAVLFWLLRERHLFWGDSRPLAINIPLGQTFHPDEPLTLFVHHLIFKAGGGRLSGAQAVALGSAVAGGIFAGWAVRWLSRRLPGWRMWTAAAGVLLAQGFVQIFCGHVENYSYLAVCLLVFATRGVDFLEGRASIRGALVAAGLAFAFHILGGLAAVPALVLVAVGLRDPARRASTVLAVAAVALVLVAGGIAARGLYAGESPWQRFFEGFLKVVQNRRDFQVAAMGSARHAAGVWSELWLTGPLTLPLLAALAVALGARAFVRSAAGVFLLTASAVYLLPILLTGEGNLGAARNWDLHAVSAIFPALAGILLVERSAPPRAASRLLAALLVVSLLHTAPWVALNTSFDRTVARVLALPLPPGRPEMMLGTHYFNAGALTTAERWFRASLARDPKNVNSASGLGLTLARRGRLAEALGPMSRAVALKPGSAQLRYDLVALLLRMQRWDAAARTLQMGLEYVPGDRRSWLALADCRMKLAEPDSAALALEAGLGFFPQDPEFLRALADAYSLWVAEYGRRGDRAMARAILERFAARFPDDPRVAAFRAHLAGAPPPEINGTAP